MKYLFIDTANNFIVSIIKDNNIIYFKNSESNSDTSAKVMDLISEAFRNTNLSINDIDKIFVVNGPGSFTGIRVGVTIAKTIGFCLSIPVIKISELELMATSINNDYIVPIIDARRNFVYGAIYNKDLDLYFKESHILLDELKSKMPNNAIIVEKCESFDLLKLIKKHEFDEPINPHNLNPNYLKKTEAEEKLND